MTLNPPVTSVLPDISDVADADFSHLAVCGDNADAIPRLAAGPVLREGADVVYLDPPYNTGNSWLYQDDRQDWEQFIRTRLLLVRGILSPSGCVAVSIGAGEVFRMGKLLQDVFPDRNVAMVTVEVSGGTTRKGIRQIAEYLLLVLPDGFTPGRASFVEGESRQPWEGATLSTCEPGRYPNQVYPVFVDPATRRIIGVGAAGMEGAFDPAPEDAPAGSDVVWPVTSRGKRCSWRLTRDRFAERIEPGWVKADPVHMPGNPNLHSVKYLPAGVLKRLAQGQLVADGREPGGALKFRTQAPSGASIPTVWSSKEHHTAKGTGRLHELIGPNDFPYPKPVGLLADIVRVLTAGKPDAVIVDAFAGSGTMFEAVQVVNDEDGGDRRSVLVTTNEGGVFEDVLTPRISAVANDPSSVVFCQV